MTALWIVLGIIAVLLFLLLFPLTFVLRYQEAVRLELRYLFFKFRLLPPKPKKPKKERAKKAKAEKEPEPEAKQKSMLQRLYEERGLWGVVGLFKELAYQVGKAGKSVISHIYVRELRVDIVVAGKDAAETATRYGQICAGVYSAFGLLCNCLDIRVKAFSIIPDFQEDAKSRQEVSAKIKIKPVFLISAGAGLLFRILVTMVKDKLSQTKTKEGGAVV